ncbi:hypothetical protein [Alkalihalophilus pseudofirmus]|uniref:hypothetical protein n=1 Tax=Alkalihalophilus pseudofirmus TaxID=79885 RepID=UPI0009F95F79
MRRAKDETLKKLEGNSFYCKLNSRQDITLPHTLRKTLLIEPGVLITVGLVPGTTSIFIKKDIGSLVDNKMVVSENGSIRIPSEITKRAGFCKGDRFRIHVREKDGLILLHKLEM